MNTVAPKDSTLQKIKNFLEDIGIKVHYRVLHCETFLPGIRIINGEIFIHEEKLLSVGDILHEAGHLAILPKDIRKTITDSVVVDENSQGSEEMAAIAWSWAALKHLDIKPEVVFHSMGYKEDSENIIENFSEKRYFGVPTLAYKGMCIDYNYNTKHLENVFPKMLKWTID